METLVFSSRLCIPLFYRRFGRWRRADPPRELLPESEAAEDCSLPHAGVGDPGRSLSSRHADGDEQLSSVRNAGSGKGLLCERRDAACDASSEPVSDKTGRKRV